MLLLWKHTLEVALSHFCEWQVELILENERERDSERGSLAYPSCFQRGFHSPHALRRVDGSMQRICSRGAFLTLCLAPAVSRFETSFSWIWICWKNGISCDRFDLERWSESSSFLFLWVISHLILTYAPVGMRACPTELISLPLK